MEIKKKTGINISIVGSCVCRDTFEIVKQYPEFEKAAAEYTVDKYIQSISFASAVAPKIDPELAGKLISDSEKYEKVNFYRKMFRLDVEKSCFEYIEEVKSDWLIIDMTPARFGLFKVGGSYLTSDVVLRIASAVKDADNSIFSELKGEKAVDLLGENSHILEKACDMWAEKFKQLYPQEKIIIVKTKNAKAFIDGSTLIPTNSYGDSVYRHDDRLFDVAFDCFIKHFPKAHIIESLPTYLGNAKHKWGMCGLHYVDETYMYLFKCFDYIMNSKASRADEHLYMLEQNRIYAEKIFEKLSYIANSTLHSERNILDVSGGITVGEYVKSGVKLTVAEDYSFSVVGKAEEDVVFYLHSGTKNPTGPWNSKEGKTKKGDYLFTTNFKCIPDKAFVQLVLTDAEKKQKWIYGHYATGFSLDHDYDYRLVRIVINKGVEVNAGGRLTLEPKKSGKSSNNV